MRQLEAEKIFAARKEVLSAGKEKENLWIFLENGSGKRRNSRFLRAVLFQIARR